MDSTLEINNEIIEERKKLCCPRDKCFKCNKCKKKRLLLLLFFLSFLIYLNGFFISEVYIIGITFFLSWIFLYNFPFFSKFFHTKPVYYEDLEDTNNKINFNPAFRKRFQKIFIFIYRTIISFRSYRFNTTWNL